MNRIECMNARQAREVRRFLDMRHVRYNILRANGRIAYLCKSHIQAEDMDVIESLISLNR